MVDDSIKKLIKTSKNFLKVKWVETKGAPKEKVLEIKEIFFIPILNKLLLISLECIDSDDREDFDISLKAFKEIYELSNQRDLGYNSSLGEWINDNNGRRVKMKDHLSWTVPSKEVFKRFYVLAAFIVKTQKYNYLKNICDLEIENEIHGEYRSEPLLFYPNFDYNSGEGTMTSIFDEAREFIVNNPAILKHYFDNNNDKVIIFSCRGDFLIEYYYFMNNIFREIFQRFINFPRFYFERVSPLVYKIVDKPDDFKILAVYNKDKFVSFIAEIIEFSHKALFSYVSDWDALVLQDINNRLAKDKGKIG